MKNKNTSQKKHIKDERSQQLNPINEKFLKSREEYLSQKDVAIIQRAEIKNSGIQHKNGLGAEAQKIFNKKK